MSNIAFLRHITENEKTAPTDLTSIRSSLISDENAGNMATASLLEGSVGVHLPTSKINSAAQRHKLTKNVAKDMGDEGENINVSDEEIQHANSGKKNMLRSTILDKDNKDIVNESILTHD